MREATQDDVGKHVIYVDRIGQRHDALITAVWGTKCINCTSVNDDKDQTDTYGRKLIRDTTSVNHSSSQQAHGYYWLWPGEERVKPE